MLIHYLDHPQIKVSDETKMPSPQQGEFPLLVFQLDSKLSCPRFSSYNLKPVLLSRIYEKLKIVVH